MARKFLNGLDMVSQKIINVGSGSSSNDAVNYTQLSAKLTGVNTATLTVSTSAPSSPSTGDLWVDTN